MSHPPHIAGKDCSDRVRAGIWIAEIVRIGDVKRGCIRVDPSLRREGQDLTG
ncbi:hypothetical protein D3C76_658320 [compost metagenome]